MTMRWMWARRLLGTELRASVRSGLLLVRGTMRGDDSMACMVCGMSDVVMGLDLRGRMGGWVGWGGQVLGFGGVIDGRVTCSCSLR
jgi:hypothetical protein